MTTTATDDDTWIKSAMNNTELAAQVLFKLHQISSSSLPHTWTIRQRRSKPLPPPLPVAAGKKSPPARASPTTPLSWSGSISGGGVEESSGLIHDCSGVSRSKVIIGPNETTPTKRPRKKKTLAELKEDETTLLKERKQLKRQLASLQVTCEKQRKENESLKKMKNDVRTQQQMIEVKECMEGKNEGSGFVLPDLNISAGEDE